MKISYVMVADVYVRQLTVLLVSRDARPREGVFALYTIVIDPGSFSCSSNSSRAS